MVGGNPSVGGGGFAASPAGTAPLYYKSAEIASGSAKNLCKKSGDVGGCTLRGTGATCSPCPRRGVCLLCRPPTVPFACFPAPYPPSPLPQRGRGRPRLFHARGFAPCIPAPEPEAALARRALAVPAGAHRGLVAGSPCRPCPRRGVCLLCRSPTVPFACFPAPYPPTPLPRRGRGSPKVYFAGGFAPGTPAFNRLRHLQNLPSRCPAGGLPGWSPAYPAFTFFLPPIPLPQRGRGCPKVYFAGGFAPGTPAFNRLRHSQSLPSRYPAAEIRVCRKTDRKRFPMSSAGSQGEGGPGERNFGV